MELPVPLQSSAELAEDVCQPHATVVVPRESHSQLEGQCTASSGQVLSVGVQEGSTEIGHSSYCISLW